MSHTNHVLDGVNKELIKYTREDYLEMAKGWTDPLGELSVQAVPFGGKKLHVVRDDLIEVGSKGRFADLLVRNTKTKTLVYVAPRVGFAGISLAKLAKMHKKKLVLFAPAAKEPSIHQLKAIELGAEMRFVRIAAMPVLNKYARDWAGEHGGTFMPFGLDHPLVIAAIVKICDDYVKVHGHKPPKQLWSVISTGVLQRGLQIGFPKTEFHAVAVARNLKAGEAGRAHVYSSGYDFHSAYKPIFGSPASDVLAQVPSVLSYDAKVFDYLTPDKIQGETWWWNVASEPSTLLKPSSVNSVRDWGDRRDLGR